MLMPFVAYSPKAIGFDHFHPSGPYALRAGGRKMVKRNLVNPVNPVKNFFLKTESIPHEK